MKKETRLFMYVLGVIVLFFAGISLLSSGIENNIVKFVIHMGIGIGLLGISCKSYDEEQFKEMSKIPFFLSLLSFFLTYIFIGRQGLFGSAFSFSGELSKLFVASLWLVMALLSSLMVIRYKEYHFIYLIVISLLLFISSLMTLFVHSNLFVLLVISILLSISHFIKNDYVKRFSKYASMGILFFTCLFFTSEDHVWILLLLSLVHIVNILIILYQDATDECQILSILSLSIYYLCLYASFSEESSLLLLMMTVGIAIIEIGANCFSLFKNSTLKKIAKYLCTVGYLFILYTVSNARTLLAILVLIAITSVVNLFIFKHDENEKNIVPIKALFALLALGQLFFSELLSSYLLFIILDIFVLLIAFMGKQKRIKNELKLLTILLSIVLVFHEFENLQFIVTSLMIIINYLFFAFDVKDQEVKEKNGYYFITLGFLFVLMKQYPCNLAYLVLSCFLLLLCALHYENRLYMSVTIPFILYVITQYIGGILGYSSVTIAADYLLLYVIGFIFALKVVKKSRVAWLNLIFVFLSFAAIGEDTFMTSLFVLIASIALYVLSKDAGSSRAFGIVFGILSLLDLVQYMEGIGAFILLLVLGLTLLFGVFKSFKVPEKEEVKVEIKSVEKKLPSSLVRSPHFCGYCGGKLDEGDKFCGHCGKKIEK